MNVIKEYKDIPIKPNNTTREEILNFTESFDSRRMPFNSHIIGAKNVDVIERIVKEEKEDGNVCRIPIRD